MLKEICYKGEKFYWSHESYLRGLKACPMGKQRAQSFSVSTRDRERTKWMKTATVATTRVYEAIKTQRQLDPGKGHLEWIYVSRGQSFRANTKKCLIGTFILKNTTKIKKIIVAYSHSFDDSFSCVLILKLHKVEPAVARLCARGVEYIFPTVLCQNDVT